MDVRDILDERAKTHGSYALTAHIAQSIKKLFRSQAGWERLTDYQKETLDMTASKIARMLSGNPNEPDHSIDVAGYHTLVADLLKAEAKA